MGIMDKITKDQKQQLVPKLAQEAEHQLKEVTRWFGQTNLAGEMDYTAMLQQRTHLIRATEAAQTLVEVYELLQREITKPFQEKTPISLPPVALKYKGATYQLRGADVKQLRDEADQLLQTVHRWTQQIDPEQADAGKVRRALESAKTLVEVYNSMQTELGVRAAASAPNILTYKGAKYKLRAAQPAAGDAVPISDEQPRDKGENAKIQNALKDSRKMYNEYKGKDPSLKETGINPDAGGDYAGGLGGDGGAGAGAGGDGGGGNGGG